MTANAPKGPTAKGPRWWVVSLRALLVVVFLAAAVTACAWALLQGAWPDLLRRGVEWAATRALDAEVEIGRLAGSLDEGFELTGLRLHFQGDGDPLEIEQLRVALNVSALVAERLLVIETLEIGGLMLDVTRDEAGQLSVAGLPESDETAPPEVAPVPGDDAAWRLEVRELSLREVRVRLTSLPEAVVLSGSGEASASDIVWPPLQTAPWPRASEGRLELVALEWNGQDLGGGRIALRTEGADISLDIALSGGAAGRLEVASGLRLAVRDDGIGWEEASLRAQLTAFDAAFALPGSSSKLNGNVRLDLEAAEDGLGLGAATVALALDASTLQGVGLDALRLDARYRASDQQLVIDRLALNLVQGALVAKGDLGAAGVPAPGSPGVDKLGGPAGRFEVSGGLHIAPRDDGIGWDEASLQAQISELDVSVALPDSSSKLTGDVQLVLEPAEDGLALGTAAVTLSLEASTLQGVDFEGLRLDARYRAADERLVIDRLALRLAPGALEVEGELDATGMRALAIRGRDLELGSLAALLGVEQSVAGRVDVAANLSGLWRDPAGSLSLDVRALEVEAVGPLRGALSLEAQGGRSYLLKSFSVAPADQLDAGLASVGEARFSWRSEAIEVAGLELTGPTGTLEASGALEAGVLRDVKVRLFDLDVGQAAAMAGVEGELAGDVTAEISASGALEAPSWTGQLSWREPQVGALRASRIGLTVEPSQDGIVAALQLEEGTRPLLELSAWLPAIDPRDATPAELFANPKARAEISTTGLELAWLASAAPDVFDDLGRVSGRLTGRVVASGATGGPKLEGEIALEAASAPLPGYGFTLGPLDGRALFQGRRVALEELRLASGEAGSAVLRGTLDWSLEGVDALDLALAFNAYDLDEVPNLSADLDGEVRLSGRSGTFEGTGVLVLNRGTLILPESMDPMLKEVRVFGLPDAAAPTGISEGQVGDDVFSRSTASIELQVPRGTRLRGRNLDAEIEGNLRLGKRAQREPELTGSLRIVKGTLRFQGRRLDLVEGSLTFEGGSQVDPTVDIVARYKVRDVKILLHLFGKSDDRQIEWQSDPPLDDADIVSYLVFGHSAAEVAGGDGNLEATAAQFAGQLLLSEFGDQLAKAFYVDRISLEIDEHDESASMVRVEKQLGEDVVVRTGYTFGSSGRPSVEIRWQFRPPHWSVQSEVTSAGTSGADLIWSFDY